MLVRLVTRAAWVWRPRSSKSFFRAVASTVGLVVLGGTGFAALVAYDNGQAIDDARDRGLKVATAVHEFRGHISAADNEVGAAMLGDPAAASGPPSLDAEVLGAAVSLTRAGLDAPRSRDGETIMNLGERLERYGSFVETSRAYPPASSHELCAREVARLQLAAPADQVRLDAETTMAAAADQVAGVAVPLAVGGLVVALVVLVVAAGLLAGRTRLALHLPLVAALLVLGTGAAFTAPDLWSQRRELQAVDAELATYTTATATTFGLFDVRAAELDVRVAEAHADELEALACNVDDDLPSEDADDRSDRFDRSVEQLVDQLLKSPEESDDAALLIAAVRDYLDSVDSGNGGDTYGGARALAVTTAERSGGVIEARLENGNAATVEPVVLVAVGLVAAGLGVGGVMHQGRRYR